MRTILFYAGKGRHQIYIMTEILKVMIILSNVYLQSLEVIKSSIKQESLGDGGQGTAVCSTDQVSPD